MSDEPRLLQDEIQTHDSKKLSQWFASRPDARLRAREAAAALAAPPQAAQPINQCDGCARGLPLDSWGIHRGKGYDLIKCTADRYISPEQQAAQPIVWALRFPGDTRINLSTVFDTEAEAREYAERCDSVAVVPLYAVPPAQPREHPADAEFIEALREEALTWKERALKAEADARRYRWLRSIDSSTEWNRAGHYAADALDRFIENRLASKEAP